MENSHKFIKLLLAIVAVLILAFVLYKFVGNNRQSSELKTPETAVVKKMDVDFSKLPEKFPTNIPIESGAKITQNYNATTPEGEFQATRSFVTTKTLAENIKIYSNILDEIVICFLSFEPLIILKLGSSTTTLDFQPSLSNILL